MRKFDSMIFMGAGRLSKWQIKDLQKRFEKGLDLLSGLQQPDHSESKEEAELAKIQRKNFEQELHDIVADLVVAFTGKDEFQYKE
jgi:hypothetical protein